MRFMYLKVVETNINLKGSSSNFLIKWYNPRLGGKLFNGSIKKVKGGDVVSIGFPPEKTGDWVALIKAKKKNSVVESEKTVISLEALSDFSIHKKNDSLASYYRDESNGVLAINAENKNFRNKFAIASTIFNGANGLYKPSFVTIAENDGESEYEIRVNGTTVYTLTNPEVKESFKTQRFELDKIYLHKNDIIEIASKAVTNFKIPENDETAYSRGRWSTLLLIPEGISIKELLKNTESFTEKSGFLEVEAEAFHYNSNNGTKRNWMLQTKENVSDETLEIVNSASENTYIEAFPDTRIIHDDPLIIGENFFPIAGVGGIVSYKIKIENPGKYYVWTKAFSTGTEDNGLHVGIKEQWPESGQRIQLCEGKNKWTWSSAQRVEENHCGVPQTIYLEIKEAGTYIISFSMREDGFKFDKWILTKNRNFIPQ